jgi:hypothetical protein
MFRNIPFVAVYLAVRSGKRSCGQRRKERSTKLPIGGFAPARTSPLEKHTFFTKIGDQICGVGYYVGLMMVVVMPTKVMWRRSL